MIIHEHFYRFLALTISIVFTSSLLKSEIIISNPGNTTSSFNFALGPHAFYQIQGRFFVGATQALENNDFALAAALSGEKQFRPLAPAKVFLNNNKNQDNPLYGSAINKLISFGTSILVVKQNDPSSLYLIDDISRYPEINVLSVHTIADAKGVITPQILALAAQTKPIPDNQLLGALESKDVFIAVANSAGNFDGNGSGIAYARTLSISDQITTNAATGLEWSLYNAQDGIAGGNKAVSVDKDLKSIGINSPIAAMRKSVDLHWDPFLERLYIALQVQSSPGINTGARAILVGSVHNGKIVFQPIAQNSAFDNRNSIVGTLASNASISIDKVRTLQTTTYLRYLVVVGGNDQATARQVFALPLVDLPGSLGHGTLAKATSFPIDEFVDADPFRFKARRFVQEAQQPEDLFTSSSVAARVGGDSVLPGDIQDVIAGKDTLFVCVGSGNNQQGGIFYSQALFDSKGRIKAWTRWQRAGVSGNILGFEFDYISGNFWYLPTNNGLTTTTVARTQWGAHDDLTQLASSEFASKKGGVQGLYDFPYITPGFSTTLGSRISLLVMTGFKKVVLAQSGRDENQMFGPEVSFTQQLLSSFDGSLRTFIPGAHAISISGGVLNKLGPIVAAEIATDNVNGWLLVGGSGGLAVLAESNGAGWSSAGLSKGFQGLTQAMKFRRIGNYTNIRKLISLGNQLFVLTPFKLDRIMLSPETIAQNNFIPVTLATAADLVAAQGSFADVVISGPLALLATSRGLFSSGNQLDIKYSKNSKEVDWQLLALPEAAGSLAGLGPISKLYALSPTGIEKEVFNTISNNALGSGNIYALNSYVGYHQAQVYRLDLDLGNGSVTNETVSLFPDLFVAGKRTFFTNFGNYRTYIATDGAIFLAANNRYGTRPFLFLLASSLKSGQVESGRTGQELSSLEIGAYSAVGRIIRRSASGSWLVHGDFGIRVNA